MKANRCETCLFWSQANVTCGLGECRRHAPVTGPKRTLRYAGEGRTFPITDDCDWCGDYQRKDGEA